MTNRIPLSRIAHYGDQFSVLVQEYAKHHREWREREEIVLREREAGVKMVNDDGTINMDAHQLFPQPRCDAIIEGALGDNGEPDFEIYDDGPPPAERLRVAKNARLHELNMQAQAETDRILPLGRRLGRERRLREVRSRDEQNVAKAMRDNAADGGFWDKIKKRKNKNYVDDVASPDFVRRTRSEDDSAFMRQQDGIAAGLDAIQEWLAEQHDAVEDIETIESLAEWQPAPLVIGESK